MSRFSFMVLPSCTPVTALWTLRWLLLLASSGRAVEQGGSLPVCPSICVQRAALKTPPPFGRTLSFPNPLRASQEVRTPAPRQAVVPFRRFYPVAEGVGRVGTPVGQACTADSGQTKRNGAKHHVQQSHPHRPPRTERRSQNRSEQQRVRHTQHRNPGKLEERQRRIRNPH